jgi:ribose 5-phosphate isomerase B
MKIAIVADNAGFELKERLRELLEREDQHVTDMGAHEYEPGDDYPDCAAAAADMVARGEADRAVLVCVSGIGVDVVMNKVPGVRSALVHDETLARLTREHNDTNVLSLGSMFMDEAKAERTNKTWLDTPFNSAARHARRMHKIEDLERKECDAVRSET